MPDSLLTRIRRSKTGATTCGNQHSKSNARKLNTRSLNFDRPIKPEDAHRGRRSFDRAITGRPLRTHGLRCRYRVQRNPGASQGTQDQAGDYRHRCQYARSRRPVGLCASAGSGPRAGQRDCDHRQQRSGHAGKVRRLWRVLCAQGTELLERSGIGAGGDPPPYGRKYSAM